MAYILSDGAMYAIAVKRPGATLNWSKSVADAQIFASAISLGRIFVDIDNALQLNATQRLNAQRAVLRLNYFLEQDGRLLGVTTDISRQWHGLLMMSLKDANGRPLSPDELLLFATALTHGLTWVGAFSPELAPLIPLGLRGFDPDTGKSWP